MDLLSINDYELIYLIRDNNEVALNLLFKKYEPYIYIKIKKFNVFERFKDDFYMEGLMAINDAIMHFDEMKSASFYTFLDIVMSRRFYRVYKSYASCDIPFASLPMELCEKEIKYIDPSKNDLYDMGLSLLDVPLDRLVYKESYLYGNTPKYISSKYNIEIKKVYNSIQKIKKVLSELNID